MKKSFLFIYLLFITTSFAKINLFVKDWHEFSIIDAQNKTIKIKGRLIYEDQGLSKISYTIKNNKKGTFKLIKDDLHNVRFAMSKQYIEKNKVKSITGFPTDYDHVSNVITIQETGGQIMKVHPDDVRFIYFNLKDDNKEIGELVEIKNETIGGFILVKQKYEQKKASRYKLNCSGPGCEITSKRKRKDSGMLNFVWKNF